MRFKTILYTILVGVFCFVLAPANFAGQEAAPADAAIQAGEVSGVDMADEVSEMVSGMGLIYFILMVLGIGTIFALLTFFGSIGAIFKPWLQSKPDLSQVVEMPGKPGKKKKKKILLAYQTKNGGSVKIGKKIHEIFTKEGYHIDMKHIPNIINDDLSEYDGFIVGGAIYWSMFLPTTREFIIKNADLFSKKPTALFMACGKMVNEFATKLEGDWAKWHRLSKVYLEPMLNQVPQFKPIDIGTFAGDIFFYMMNLPEFVMMGVLMFKNGMKQGYYIDLDRVSKWTKKLVKEFKKHKV